MSKQTEALKLALEALELHGKQYPHMVKGYCLDAITAIREALAEQPAQQEQGDSNCQDDDGCPTEIAVLQRFWRGEPIPTEHYPAWFRPAQQQEPDRVKFERHWRKTRGEKKANRELPRHPLQPQTYIQDSANRHWVTWQAAVRSVSPQPAQPSKPWVGLTKEEAAATAYKGFDEYWTEDCNGSETEAWAAAGRAIEAKLREKNT